MKRDQMKRDISGIKRVAEMDLEALSYKHALLRHDLRGIIVHLIWTANLDDDLRMENEGDAFDPSNPCKEKTLLRRFDDLATELDDGGLKQWRDDQIEIENYHRRAYGNIEKLIRLQAFGATPEAMFSHQTGMFCEFIHNKLSKKEKRQFRNELRSGIKRVSLGPLKLHPAPCSAKGEFFDPEFYVGIRDCTFRFLYPKDDIPEYDEEKTHHYGEPR